MTPQSANPPLLLRNARVYAPRPLGLRDLLMVEGRILAVDASIEITGLPGLHEMDAQGAVVSPGLVDTLTHITGGGGEGGYGSRMPAMPPEDAWLSGVTTVTGALGTDAVQRSHTELLAHARLLATAGVSAHIYAGNYHLPIRTLTGSVQTDLAWIPEVIGVGEVAIADHRGSHPSAAELARLASEVRVGAMLGGKQGVLSIHVGDHDAGLNVLFEAAENYPVRLSHFYPTHINRTRDLLQQGCRFAREGGTIDFTATTNAGLLAAGDVDSPLAVAEALAAGVPGDRITLSSDAYASLPEFDAEGRFLRVGMGRLDSLADAVQRGVRDVGLSFETLLRTVSLNPAETLGLPRKGRLEAGADADLVLWSEHHEVLGVISGGVVRRWPD
ncbi:beta-aspartyl-peptidase [Natronospirillum operosum]|uniref:Isoaspartyl dipeptidase n=1 Tax=Natronospirillum operosum TaxID=2759953 RepID=A0A4Z0W7G6_9GAMM|nr:beta-aspartyl-peptidase [Natronospirillum operosum]TGG90642.1 beta-aspartyl-peptidase [Natronospirillum operosum]